MLLSLKNQLKLSVSVHVDTFRIHSSCHGREEASTGAKKLLDVNRRQGVAPRGGVVVGGEREQVRLLHGGALPLHRLRPARGGRSLHRPHGRVPPLLPLTYPLSPVREEVRKVDVVPRSGVSNISAGLLQFAGRWGIASVVTDCGSESDDDGNENARVDRDEVDRVCRVIEELLGMDRNMEAVLDRCEIQLSQDLVVHVLQRFRYARKPAFQFFCWAGQRCGFSHDSRTYNEMLSILARNRQFETMLSMMEEMGENGVLSMVTFLIAMRAFAAAKERKKAVAIFDLMNKYKFCVGVETINCLLDALGQAKLVKEAQALFGKLQGRFTPNIKTYTVLLKGWCKVKNLMQAGKVWNEMVDKGLKPDIVAHCVMLEGLLRCKKVSDAIKLFHVMRAKGPQPNATSYMILIQDFCKKGRMDEAVEYFDDMINLGCQPNVAVYTCLITGFGNQNRMDMVFELLKEMKEKNCPPDGLTYNVLIKLMTRQKMPEDAAKIYRKMIQNGIEPSNQTYDMIMSSYFKAKNFEMGQAVWDEMMARGYCPHGGSYTILIAGLISLGRSGEACKYLEEMLERGMKAPPLDYDKLAADLCRSGKPHLLKELASKLEFSGKFELSNALGRRVR